ncbi:MAG: riboflavin biosynthesis protein RibD [Proteobacteria bacterium]|nr:riboflavin biosynthesis protein RibD [Pseudomonadota bacterium]
MSSKTDQDYMLQALELGETVKGTTGDNPWVGCLIIKDGIILGQGAMHAEAAALQEAQKSKHSLDGATLYCTVEPCSFEGRTPSCAKAIARSGISRVVASIRDPHPKVNGEGFSILRQAGVEVTEGIKSQQVEASLLEWLNGYR